MSAKDAEERLILDSRFGSGSPATWYVGLGTTTSSEDGTGFTEPVGNAYARVAVTNNVTNFPAASTTANKTVKRNGTAITWPNPTGSWGLLGEVGFFDVSTGGTPRYTQGIDDPIAPKSGNTPVELAPNELEIECE